jgi:transposase
MLIQENITTDLKIESLGDLSKLKEFEGGSNLKINKSEIARKLGVDRRTVGKYIEGYEKPKSRKSKSQFDEYYDIIKELLENEDQIFAYKRVLWQYMKDNHEMLGAASSFRRYISQHKEFQDYFTKKASVKSATPMRYETEVGKQAQVDWKESITFKLDTGAMVILNIFVFLLSFSRFRIYRVSLAKTREVLCHLLTDSFETIGGVPETILFDNMKAVMDDARTEYRKGVINKEFETFAKDYGFEVHPCIAGRPQTKGRVEAPMKILDEIMAYNGKLSYEGVIKKITEINERENKQYHESYQMHPVMGLKREKDFLSPLPPATIRNLYHIKTKQALVNASSMISYLSNQYSVAPEYIGKRVDVQEHDGHLCIYYNKLLITIHPISDKKLNYLHEHYVEITKLTLPFDDERIEEIAKENLQRIGERYEYHNT